MIPRPNPTESVATVVIASIILLLGIVVSIAWTGVLVYAASWLVTAAFGVPQLTALQALAVSFVLVLLLMVVGRER